MHRAGPEDAPMPTEKPDADTSITLMMRLRRAPADVQAWEEFVRRYQPMIREWCLRWGSRPDDADDIVAGGPAQAPRRDEDVRVRSRPQLPGLAQDGHPERLERLRPVAPPRIDRGPGVVPGHPRLARGPRRPERPDGGRLRSRAARPGDAPGREAGQAGELAGFRSRPSTSAAVPRSRRSSG